MIEFHPNSIIFRSQWVLHALLIWYKSVYQLQMKRVKVFVNMTVIKSRLGSKHYVPRRFLIDKNTLALIDEEILLLTMIHNIQR